MSGHKYQNEKRLYRLSPIAFVNETPSLTSKIAEYVSQTTGRPHHEFAVNK